MSLFVGLARCDSPYCQRYIYEKDAGKYTYGTQKLCSRECVHVVQLAEYIHKAQGQLDKNQLMEEVTKHFTTFKDELLADTVRLRFLDLLGLQDQGPRNREGTTGIPATIEHRPLLGLCTKAR